MKRLLFISVLVLVYNNPNFCIQIAVRGAIDLVEARTI